MYKFTIRIPDDMRTDNMADWLYKKICKVNMSDITTDKEFKVTVKNRDIYITGDTDKQLKIFADRLSKLISSDGLDKILQK